MERKGRGGRHPPRCVASKGTDEEGCTLLHVLCQKEQDEEGGALLGVLRRKEWDEEGGALLVVLSGKKGTRRTCSSSLCCVKRKRTKGRGGRYLSCCVASKGMGGGRCPPCCAGWNERDEEGTYTVQGPGQARAG